MTTITREDFEEVRDILLGRKRETKWGRTHLVQEFSEKEKRRKQRLISRLNQSHLGEQLKLQEEKEW